MVHLTGREKRDSLGRRPEGRSNKLVWVFVAKVMILAGRRLSSNVGGQTSAPLHVSIRAQNDAKR